MSDFEPDDDNVILMSFADEWAQLIRRMGAQLSLGPEELVAAALRHFDNVLSLTVESPIVIKRSRSGEVNVGTLIEEGTEAPERCPHCGSEAKSNRSTSDGTTCMHSWHFA